MLIAHRTRPRSVFLAAALAVVGLAAGGAAPPATADPAAEPVPTATVISTLVPQATVELTLSATNLVEWAGGCAADLKPSAVIATAVAHDTSGAPLAGAEVTFSANAPLTPAGPTVVTTGPDGIARVSLAVDPSSLASPATMVPVTGYVWAHIDSAYGSGASAAFTFSRGELFMPPPPQAVLSTRPAVPPAEGTTAYAATLELIDTCGRSLEVGQEVTFSVTGQARLTPDSPVTIDQSGRATVEVSDAAAETVTLTVAIGPDSSQVDLVFPAPTVVPPVTPLTVSPARGTVGTAGGTVTFTVTADTTWTLRGAPAWVHQGTYKGPAGTQQVSLTVDPILPGTTRQATLTVSSAGESVTYTVNQTDSPTWTDLFSQLIAVLSRFLALLKTLLAGLL